MKFRYKQFGDVYRPVIPVTIKLADKAVSFEALVDSGADLCIFDAELGEVIGMDLKEGKAQKVTGIAGQTSLYYLHTIEVEVGGWSFETEVGFLPRLAQTTPHGVLGQRGFFENFVVTFDLAKKAVELKNKK